MLVDVAHYFVIAVGAVVLALSVWGMVSPDKLMDLVSGAIHRPWGMALAVGVRLLLGMALILVAANSKFPTVFGYLGWITVTIAAILPFVGRERLARLIDWVDGSSPVLMRVWLLFGIAFGAFLIYAA